MIVVDTKKSNDTGTQFTCFTGTKKKRYSVVPTEKSNATEEDLLNIFLQDLLISEALEKVRLLALLVQKYKY